MCICLAPVAFLGRRGRDSKLDLTKLRFCQEENHESKRRQRDVALYEGRNIMVGHGTQASLRGNEGRKG